MNDSTLEVRSNLRTSLRTSRSAISAEIQQQTAVQLHALCLPVLEPFSRVAGYFAVGGEIPVISILSNVRARGGISFAPILSEGSTLLFAPFNDNTPMIDNRFNIKEPDVDPSHYIMPMELDAVLVPLLGFDKDCNRMGMGGGFYDRSFAQRREQQGKPVLIGVAYDQQQTDTVFPDWWDVALDMVVTESRVIHRRTI